jgi:hypothetical protein
LHARTALSIKSGNVAVYRGEDVGAKVPVEVRIALEDVMIDYCYAVDNLKNVEELLDLFTDDAVLDFSDIGLPAMHGLA